MPVLLQMVLSELGNQRPEASGLNLKSGGLPLPRADHSVMIACPELVNG